MVRGNRLGLYLVVAGALAAAYWLSPVRLGVVCGESMSPAFENGELFLIDRTYYRSHPVVRGDVVVLRHNGTIHMKRVAAVEGESLHVMMTKYDGVPFDELVMRGHLAALQRIYRERPEFVQGSRIARYVIPRGRVYVLGDNLSVSEDSRRFGLVDVAEIEGRVIPAHESQGHVPRLAGTFRPRGRL